MNGWVILALLLIDSSVALLVGFVAGSRGYSRAGFALISFFASFLVALLLLIAMPRKHPAELSVTCPFCKEQIRAGAMICKHCGSQLEPTNGPTEFDSDGKRNTVDPLVKASIATLAIGIVCGFLAFIPPPTGGGTETPSLSEASNAPVKALPGKELKTAVTECLDTEGLAIGSSKLVDPSTFQLSEDGKTFSMDSSAQYYMSGDALPVYAQRIEECVIEAIEPRDFEKLRAKHGMGVPGSPTLSYQTENFYILKKARNDFKSYSLEIKQTS